MMTLTRTTAVVCALFCAPLAETRAELAPNSLYGRLDTVLTVKPILKKKDGSEEKTYDDTKQSEGGFFKKKDRKGRTLGDYKAFQLAHARVSTSCFPPELRAILAKVEKRYGSKPIVQSGYRSASYNRRVGGARKSYHVKCQAADIKVKGVNKYHLAKFLKSLSGVGGVGTYGCNTFVHVDVGPKRTWHWRCRSKRRRA